MKRQQPLRIVIFGAYKTGTTGLYYKIANSAPGRVKSVFEQTAYAADADAETAYFCVLAKTIAWFDGRSTREKFGSFLGFDKKIVLTRDPRDWIVSALLFLIQQEPSLYSCDANICRLLRVLREKERDPRAHSVAALLKLVLELSENHDYAAEIQWMHDHYLWLPRFEADLGQHVVVRYEDFVDGRLADLQAYLGFPLQGADQVSAEHDHVPRTRSYGNWKSWFTEEDIALFMPAFSSYIQHYGYDASWQLDPSPVIRSEHCTRYVIKTAEKRRGRPVPFD
jgi:hypothetical protein